MRVAVVDGQGGGMGRLVVEKLRQEFGNSITILALGTNALATSMMLKAGANEGASGENAVVYSAGRVDVVLGSIAIIAAHAFSGELTPRMAEAIATSNAAKVLLPINRYGLEIAGVVDAPLPIQVDHLVNKVRRLFDTGEHHSRV